MIRDLFDNPISSATAATVAAYARYADSWLGYGTELPAILAAAAADPGSVTANVHAAMVHMALEAGSGHRAARPFLMRAVAELANASARERSLVAAAEAWSQGDAFAVVAIHREHARDFPRDLVAAKWGQYHAFNVGDFDAMRDIAQAVLPAHEGVPYAHGMQAFALEQCHDLAGAERAARRAIALKRGEPWAHHALAHVMETQGRLDEGVAFLRAVSDSWADRSIFIREHNWWHLALFHLDRDEVDEVLRIFDTQLWGTWPEFAQEQIGAVAALWRLELRGVDVGQRWMPVARAVAAREAEHLLPFHDIHYAYALARAGNAGEAERFLGSLDARAERCQTSFGAVWREVAAPAARGVAAHAKGDYRAAARLLNAVVPRLQEIGGSHAQRDLFVQTALDAELRSGGKADAIATLDDRVKARPQALGLQRLLGEWRRFAASPVHAAD